ncbi:hypothetical protein [Kitasatospora sp. NPDC094015]
MTSERDRLVADRVGEAVRQALGGQVPPDPSGTGVAQPDWPPRLPQQ